MVDTYKDRGRLYRAATDHLHEARQLYPDLTGLVIFPRYEASEVIALARDGELLPTGLTRHLIQGRALRTNYPLSELSAPDVARGQERAAARPGGKQARFPRKFASMGTHDIPIRRISDSGTFRTFNLISLVYCGGLADHWEFFTVTTLKTGMRQPGRHPCRP